MSEDARPPEAPVEPEHGFDQPSVAHPRTPSIVYSVVRDWIDHGAPTRSAAIAFYSITSLAPVSVLVVWVGARVWEQESLRQAVLTRFTEAAGPDATDLVRAVLEGATLPVGGALIPTLIAFAVFAFSATAAFSQLQSALRDVWEVPPETGRLVRGFLRRRLVALILVMLLGLTLGVLLAASVAVSTVLRAFPIGWSPELLVLVDVGVSGLTLITMFTVVFRVLPDARVPWREAAIAGVVTGVLHLVGQQALARYLGSAGIASVYGAAGSFVVFLLWVYYSSLVFLLGAEASRALSARVAARSEPA